MRGGHCSSKKSKDTYKCDSCQKQSLKPQNCCGKPMKKQRQN